MSASNPDIRNEVDNSRGLIKKIQLVVPGFRGYRQLEDLRAADELLRKQVASYLQIAESKLQDFRTSLSTSGNFQYLTQVASALSRLQQFEGELLHSEQGYTGFSPMIRIDAQKLNALYEYDYTFLQSASEMVNLSDWSALSGDFSAQDLQQKLTSLVSAIQKMKNSWEQRIITVEEIKQNPGGQS